MNPISFYLKSLYKKTHGYRPTWFPNAPIQLGDVGILENDVFIKDSALNDYKIFFKKITSESDATIDFSSERGITLTTKLEGKVEPLAISLGKADAGFIIEFNHKNGFIFRTKGSRTSRIDNLGIVKEKVLKRFKQGQWNKNLVIISELIEAKSATILLSGQAGSKIELKAQGNFNVSTMDIADASLNLKLQSGQALAATIVGQKKIKPLYRAIGVKQSFFSGKSVGSREVESEPQGIENDVEISEIEIDTSAIENDFLNNY